MVEELTDSVNAYVEEWIVLESLFKSLIALESTTETRAALESLRITYEHYATMFSHDREHFLHKSETIRIYCILQGLNCSSFAFAQTEAIVPTNTGELSYMEKTHVKESLRRLVRGNAQAICDKHFQGRNVLLITKYIELVVQALKLLDYLETKILTALGNAQFSFFEMEERVTNMLIMLSADNQDQDVLPRPPQNHRRRHQRQRQFNRAHARGRQARTEDEDVEMEVDGGDDGPDSQNVQSLEDAVKPAIGELQNFVEGPRFQQCFKVCCEPRSTMHFEALKECLNLLRSINRTNVSKHRAIVEQARAEFLADAFSCQTEVRAYMAAMVSDKIIDVVASRRQGSLVLIDQIVTVLQNKTMPERQYFEESTAEMCCCICVRPAEQRAAEMSEDD